jgi:hypothetical protein
MTIGKAVFAATHGLKVQGDLSSYPSEWTATCKCGKWAGRCWLISTCQHGYWQHIQYVLSQV